MLTAFSDSRYRYCNPFTFFQTEIFLDLTRIWLLEILVKTFLYPVSLFEFIQSLDEVKRVVSFWEHHSNHSLLPGIGGEKERISSRRIVGPLHVGVVGASICEHTLREQALIFIYELNFAALPWFVHHLAFASPHLFATPVL